MVEQSRVNDTGLNTGEKKLYVESGISIQWKHGRLLYQES